MSWNVSCQPGCMVKDSIATVTDDIADKRKTKTSGHSLTSFQVNWCHLIFNTMSRYLAFHIHGRLSALGTATVEMLHGRVTINFGIDTLIAHSLPLFFVVCRLYRIIEE